VAPARATRAADDDATAPGRNGWVHRPCARSLGSTPSPNHEVAARIAEYRRLGIDEFVLSGYPHLEEAYWSQKP
jgi:alkanesulfonate monooxygenase SsuD/methylene tetrahydromethanopterin reductase-like flavin-dependent oxidoreductase (luciferase family)